METAGGLRDLCFVAGGVKQKGRLESRPSDPDGSC